jgi:hypothetical protein
MASRDRKQTGSFKLRAQQATSSLTNLAIEQRLERDQGRWSFGIQPKTRTTALSLPAASVRLIGFAHPRSSFSVANLADQPFCRVRACSPSTDLSVHRRERAGHRAEDAPGGRLSNAGVRVPLGRIVSSAAGRSRASRVRSAGSLRLACWHLHLFAGGDPNAQSSATLRVSPFLRAVPGNPLIDFHLHPFGRLALFVLSAQRFEA